MYYVITSVRWKRVIASRSFDELYAFIMKNKDSKIRTLDWSGKTRVIDRRRFMINLYKSSKKLHEDKIKIFHIAERLIKGNQNLRDFLHLLDLREEFDKYKEVNKNKL